MIGGSVCAAGAFAVSALFHFALVVGADSDAMSGEAMQAINALDAHSWILVTTSLGVFALGAAGMLIRRTGIFRVLGWIALVAGIAFYFPFASFVAMVVTGLWIITASILLFRRDPA